MTKYILALSLFVTTACAYQERELIAAVLIAEAGGEPVSGMREVAGVIQNRAKSTKTTPAAVVLKPKQFSCLNGKTALALINQAKSHPKFSTALELAEQKHKTDATHYYNPRLANPGWAKSLKVVKRIGNHVFLK